MRMGKQRNMNGVELSQLKEPEEINSNFIKGDDELDALLAKVTN